MLNLLNGADTQQKQWSPQQHCSGLQRSVADSLHLAVGSSRANSSRNSELFQVHVMENIHVETSIKFMQLFKILQWTYELKMLLFSGEKNKSC